MRVIGLTGSIACGKSTVSRYLTSLGFPVVDGDKISRELTVPGSPVLMEIRRNFGDRYINDNGNLHRRALGALIFQDEHARSRLDAVMAPHLKKLTTEYIEKHQAEGAELCFLDMPLLFEKGYDHFCHSVWSVWLPEDVQISRLMSRDHLTEDEAIKRIRSVMTSDEKASRANYVIDNTGTVRQTLSVVDRLLQEELNLSENPDGQCRNNREVIRNSPFTCDGTVLGEQKTPPETMERPAAADRRNLRQRAEWQVPRWMKITLAVFAILLCFSAASYWMMSGYLARQRAVHTDEEEAIRQNYHFDDFENMYRGWIEKYADEYNLRPAFVAAVIMAESSFRPEVSSKVSARGLMQLMRDTASDRAKDLGIQNFNFEMAYDPELNIRLGCCHLRYLIRMFGDDLPTVMVAYNVGEGNVKRNWLSSVSVTGGGNTVIAEKIPDQGVKSYVQEVARNYGIYQEKFYPDPVSDRAADSSNTSPRQPGTW